MPKQLQQLASGCVQHCALVFYCGCYVSCVYMCPVAMLSQYDGYPVYKLQYKLPAGYTCERCILQWNYLSGHKCHPPCLKSDRFYPDCRKNPKFSGTYAATMDYCEGPYAAYPEEFWVSVSQ